MFWAGSRKRDSGRSGLSFSGGHRWVWRWAPSLAFSDLPLHFLWISLIWPFASSTPSLIITSEHFPIAPDSAALPAILLSVKALTYAIWLFWSYPVKANWLWMDLSGAHRCSVMFSPQMFNVLFPLSYSTAVACWHIQRREHKLSQGISSAEKAPVFICIFLQTVSPVRSFWQWNNLRDNNGL